jgi:hypothetical protein
MARRLCGGGVGTGDDLGLLAGGEMRGRDLDGGTWQLGMQTQSVMGGGWLD